MAERLYHPTTRVSYGGHQIKVDIGMAPLLQAMWARGYQTQFSCEGGEDPNGPDQPAHIIFTDEAGGHRFLHDCATGIYTPPRDYYDSAGMDIQEIQMVLINPIGCMGNPEGEFRAMASWPKWLTTRIYDRCFSNESVGSST
jgi:hypothetical protein